MDNVSYLFHTAFVQELNHDEVYILEEETDYFHAQFVPSRAPLLLQYPRPRLALAKRQHTYFSLENLNIKIS
jgi:hypothetical protein